MWNGLIFVIWLVIRIGMFNVLNVIGVVLVIRYSFVVYNGLKFRFISSVLVIVIGVLKLVVFFSNVLKEKLISNICKCWLLVMEIIELWIILNCLLVMVNLYRNIVVIIIYVIGYNL